MNNRFAALAISSDCVKTVVSGCASGNMSSWDMSHSPSAVLTTFLRLVRKGRLKLVQPKDSQRLSVVLANVINCPQMNRVSRPTHRRDFLGKFQVMAIAGSSNSPNYGAQ